MSVSAASEADSTPTRSPRELWWGVLLLVITLIAYLPAIGAGYIWDDDWYVLNNRALTAPDGLRTIWFGMRLEPVREGEIPQYYPLVHSTYWLERRLWGLDATGYHAVNVALHAGAALLLWRVLRRLKVPGAWVGAMIFAVHPVNVESVAWITERKNVLAAVFYFLSALLYLRWRPIEREAPEDSAKDRWGWYLAALLAFLLSLFSKTVTCSLPAVILLIIWWNRRHLAWRDVWPTLPFFVIALPLALFTSRLERVRVGAHGAEWDLEFWDRFLIAGRAVWFYLQKLLWPHPLVFIYPRWTIDAGALWQWLFPIAAIAAVVALFLLRHRIGRAPLVVALFFGGTLFPALGFFNLLPMRYSYVADHFQYIASVGPIAGVVALGAWGLRKHAMAGRIAACAVIAIFATLTFAQARVYRNADTLWRHVIRHNPRSTMALVNHGLWLLDQNRLDEAESRFDEALQVDPNHSDALANLGLIERLRGRPSEAFAYYERAIEANPGSPDVRFKYALALRDAGDLDGAVAQLRDALEIDPRHEDARLELGMVLSRTGDVAGAIDEYQRALEENPESIRARTNLAELLMKLGRPTDAERLLREVLERNADHPIANNTLGILRASGGDLEGAVEHFRRAVKTNPRFAEGLNNLGKALEMQGDLPAAIEQYEAAVRARPDFAPAVANLERVRDENLKAP